MKKSKVTKQTRTIKIHFDTYLKLKVVAAIRDASIVNLIEALVSDEARRIDLDVPPTFTEDLSFLGKGAKILSGA